MKRQVLPFLLLIILIVSETVAAAQLPAPASLPIEVTAQQLEADQGQRLVTFSGEVVAIQGDITLYCDVLKVFSLPEQDQVDRLEAFGNVRVVQLDRTATADRAVYRQRQGTLALSGNAEVHQGQNRVTGEEVMVYLQENRSVVKSGGSNRVKATLFPQQKQGQE